MSSRPVRYTVKTRQRHSYQPVKKVPFLTPKATTLSADSSQPQSEYCQKSLRNMADLGLGWMLCRCDREQKLYMYATQLQEHPDSKRRPTTSPAAPHATTIGADEQTLPQPLSTQSPSNWFPYANSGSRCWCRSWQPLIPRISTVSRKSPRSGCFVSCTRCRTRSRMSTALPA